MYGSDPDKDPSFAGQDHSSKQGFEDGLFNYALDNMIKASQELFHICSNTNVEPFYYEQVMLTLKQFQSDFEGLGKFMKDTSIKRCVSPRTNDIPEISNILPPENQQSPSVEKPKKNRGVQASIYHTTEKKKDKKIAATDHADEFQQYLYFDSAVNVDRNSQSSVPFSEASNNIDNNYFTSHNVGHPAMYSLTHGYPQYTSPYVPPVSHFHIPCYSHEINNPNMVHLPAQAYMGQQPFYFPSPYVKQSKNQCNSISDNKQYRSSRKHSYGNNNCEKTEGNKHSTPKTDTNSPYYFSNIENNTIPDNNIQGTEYIASYYNGNENSKDDKQYTLSPYDSDVVSKFDSNTLLNQTDSKADSGNVSENIHEEPLDKNINELHPLEDSSLIQEAELEFVPNHPQQLNDIPESNKDSQNFEKKEEISFEKTVESRSVELSNHSNNDLYCKNLPPKPLFLEEKGITFSDVIKTTKQPRCKNLPPPKISLKKTYASETIKTPVKYSEAASYLRQYEQKATSKLPFAPNMRRKNRHNWPSPVKQTQMKKTEIEDSFNRNVSPQNSDTDDSGWEIVKTKKWREPFDMKRSRSLYKDIRPAPLSAVKVIEPKVEVFQSNELNNRREDFVGFRGVAIDPNEMYSTYMQYLNNVKEEREEDCVGPKQPVLVLHPETSEEKNDNPDPASLQQITDFVNNDPVRALDFKKQLDNKIRHQEDMKKKNDEKQQLAQEKRLQYLHDKKTKFRGALQKVEEAKAAQHQLALIRKNKLDDKLKKAEEKRKMHLTKIKRKAHDEEEKLKEIAFINELEAQNRRHDSMALRQEQEGRLQSIVEERQRRIEEKAAKEAAAEERRKALEAERQEKLELMKEKRRIKEEFIDRKQQQKEYERLVNAREKAREREERLQARHSAQQATVEELQKRIQQKQEESARRHIECIELIRQKAIEIGAHRNTSDYVPKYLSLYKPEEENSFIGKNRRKHLKKIKLRMRTKGANYIKSTHDIFSTNDCLGQEILDKMFKRVQKMKPHKVFLWETKDCLVLDRIMDEIMSYVSKDCPLRITLRDMRVLSHFEFIIDTFNQADHENISPPALRVILKIVSICAVTCVNCHENCLYFFLSNYLATFLDSLKFGLQALERPSKPWTLIVEILLRLHCLILDGLNELPQEILLTIPDFSSRLKDVISYILCTGLVNRLVDVVRPSIKDEKFIYRSLAVPSILFFNTLLSPWSISDDLTSILKSTDLLGTVPLLYEALMKHISDGGILPGVVLPTLSLFLKLADLDLKLFQTIMGVENIALQWRAIASALMSFCVTSINNSNYKISTSEKQDILTTDLLNHVLKLVAYFAVNNKENQTLLQSGKQPTVLQQLVKLPFQYFCDPEFIKELFPTLIACSYNNATNKVIVENEMDYSALEKFMESEIGLKNKIIQLLHAEEEPLR